MSEKRHSEPAIDAAKRTQCDSPCSTVRASACEKLYSEPAIQRGKANAFAPQTPCCPLVNIDLYVRGQMYVCVAQTTPAPQTLGCPFVLADLYVRGQRCVCGSSHTRFARSSRGPSGNPCSSTRRSRATPALGERPSRPMTPPLLACSRTGGA